jgi:hypothetical protein
VNKDAAGAAPLFQQVDACFRFVVNAHDATSFSASRHCCRHPASNSFSLRSGKRAEVRGHSFCSTAGMRRMSRGGRLTIRAEEARFASSDQSANSNRNPGQFFRLSVADTGS